MQSQKESVSYWHYLEPDEKEALRCKKLIDNDGKRVDGRKADEIRPTFAQVGVISEAAGSAYIEMMKTKVICAIYGPNESGRRSEFSMEVGSTMYLISYCVVRSDFRAKSNVLSSLLHFQAD